MENILLPALAPCPLTKSVCGAYFIAAVDDVAKPWHHGCDVVSRVWTVLLASCASILDVREDGSGVIIAAELDQLIDSSVACTTKNRRMVNTRLRALGPCPRKITQEQGNEHTNLAIYRMMPQLY